MNRKLREGLMALLAITLIFGFAAPVPAAGPSHEGGLGEVRIPLNIADEDQLMRIEGMTEELAEAIVEYRENEGFFKKPEDLLKVPGLDQEIYDQLDPKVGAEGELYCVGKPGSGDEEEEPLLAPSKC